VQHNPQDPRLHHASIGPQGQPTKSLSLEKVIF
jgi:hypothetical protein